MKLLIFGGTGDARKLIESLQDKAEMLVCVASSYGASLLPAREGIRVLIGAKEAQDIRELLDQEEVDAVIDATHPYAGRFRKELSQALEGREVLHLRLSRSLEDIPGFSRYEEIVEYLTTRPGRVLLSSGGNSARAFCCLPDFSERVLVRLLPMPEKIRELLDLGYPAKHLLALQGPFSEEMNRVMLRDYDIRFLVSKNSGEAGGFEEKRRAAEREGVELLLLQGAVDEGLLLEDMLKKLEEL